jgi:hypothetical protein
MNNRRIERAQGQGIDRECHARARDSAGEPCTDGDGYVEIYVCAIAGGNQRLNRNSNLTQRLLQRIAQEHQS